jgi:hypothetical protein
VFIGDIFWNFSNVPAVGGQAELKSTNYHCEKDIFLIADEIEIG